VAFSRPGSRVELTILRDGRRQRITVTLGTLDPRLLSEAGEGQESSPESGESASSSATLDKLGLSVRDVTEELARRYRLDAGREGVLITGVRSGSVAEMAGLQPGMLIVEANGQSVRTVRDLERVLADVRSGDTVLFRIRQGANYLYVALSVS